MHDLPRYYPALPMGSLHPADAIAFYATNPLLLEAYPDLCATRAAELEAGTLDGKRAYAIATGMSAERLRLRVQLGSGHDDQLSEQPEWNRFEELLQVRWLSARDRSSLRAFARQCYPTEWAWLNGYLEKLALRRAEEQEQEFLQAA